MSTIPAPTALDQEIYSTRIAPFLPPRIIDIHTHVWQSKTDAPRQNRSRLVTWPALVASENPIEDLVETYRRLFPDKEVVPMMFGHLNHRAADFAGGNGYIAELIRRRGFPGLMYARPDWSAEELVVQLRLGRFSGVKVYLSLADPKLAVNEITIFDFLPPHQLAVINELGMIVMLHIPRDGRLRDPVNIEQMIEIERRYPSVQLIIAHVGRAYCDEDMGDALALLGRETRRMWFDFSANTNAVVFAELIRRIGSRRILFGSDLPIVRMRCHRICEHGKYINLVPKGLYGDVSVDSHMREVDGAAAAEITYFLYEEILAFKAAAEATGLTKQDVADVFCHNAERLLNSVKPIGQ
ncbi:MAG: amidohydrolase family protein [Opitutaceae bacterium]|nr:amidohydrolase family protein [Opitutaceae bacterium]